eukprot:271289-Amphidinium_carterae.1
MGVACILELAFMFVRPPKQLNTLVNEQWFIFSELHGEQRTSWVCPGLCDEQTDIWPAFMHENTFTVYRAQTGLVTVSVATLLLQSGLQTTMPKQRQTS